MTRLCNLPSPYRTKSILAAVALALAACSTDTTSRPASVATVPARAAVGIERIMGQDARALAGLLGPATLDVREGTARKLQWRGSTCVLDAYLYPPVNGQGEAKVTWVDARTGTGTDMDRTACLATLAMATNTTARR